MRRALAALWLLVAWPAFADTVPELKLVSEHPVDGMRGGNLSGLALCGGELWTVSDRDDDLLYRLGGGLEGRRCGAAGTCGAGQWSALELALENLGRLVHSRW